MTVYLEGGAACGKSRLGEAWAVSLHRGSPGPLLYLATMEAGDGESLRRVARHRAARAGKGFWTLERPLGLAALDLPPRATVLLEDLGNLAANELYSPGGGGKAALLAGLEHLLARAENLVVIGNSVFEENTGGETERYLSTLAAAQALCAAESDAAAQVICGIPCYYKHPGKEAPCP